MAEPTITCPSCKSEIKLTESLAAPLLEATRRQFQQQLAQKDSDIAKREEVMLMREKRLANDTRRLQEQVESQVADQLKTQRTRIVEEEARKAKQANAVELEHKARELADLQAALQDRKSVV
jgi:hypothetical protein